MVMYTFEKSLLHENDDELEYFRIIFVDVLRIFVISGALTYFVVLNTTL